MTIYQNSQGILEIHSKILAVVVMLVATVVVVVVTPAVVVPVVPLPATTFCNNFDGMKILPE